MRRELGFVHWRSTFNFRTRRRNFLSKLSYVFLIMTLRNDYLEYCISPIRRKDLMKMMKQQSKYFYDLRQIVILNFLKPFLVRLDLFHKVTVDRVLGTYPFKAISRSQIDSWWLESNVKY